MRTFKINPSTGDMVLDAQNRIVMVDGDDAIIQKLERTITTNLREWFLDESLGFDKFEILGKKHKKERSIQLIYDAILQVSEISRVEELTFEIDKENRILLFKTTLLKSDGELLEVDFNADGIRF